MPTQLSLHAVTKRYADRTVLDAVSCALAADERTAIVGENGSGKSTLLRLLAGRERPDEGRVTVVTTGGLGYLGQDAPLPGHLTVRQAIDEALAELRRIEARLRELEPRLGGGDERLLTEYGDLSTVFELRGGYDADARVERTLHALGVAGIDRSRRLGELSGGEQARLHLAAVLAAGPEVLLLDEPTNHLDDDSLTWLEEHLRGRRGSTVVVSHDRVFLDRVADTLVEVDGDRHTLVRYGDGYPGFLAARAAARQRRVQAHLDWQAEVARLREAVATTARQVAPGREMKDRNKAAYDRNGGRVQQSVASRVRNAGQRLRRLAERPVPAPPEPLRFTPPLAGAGGFAPPPVAGGSASPPVAGGFAPPVAGGRADGSGRVLLAADGVAVDGRLRRTTLVLRDGERLLVSGANGAGKSTLLRVLAGDLAPESGRVVRRGRVGYLPQEVGVERAGETLLAAFGRDRPGPVEEHVERLVALGLFDRAQFGVPVGELSTGQRRRLALARLVDTPADVLLLDEPTNHLSPGLVEELEAALAVYPGAVVAVSHDRRLRGRWRGERRTMTAGILDPAPVGVTVGG
ncbi:ABC-F family ATP-binding cassette domain-containing protein [Plantactinospora sp. WMMB334]|uniref:ABC-F family ATP-binding cassette domain-containing protein n=1 Tax=Plantactinospora sp. WMMB334 TaxID=3404119 RepID=UPI003B965841